MTEIVSDAAAVPFVKALQAFLHPYDVITAPALAVYAVGNERDADDEAWRVACRDRFAAEMGGGAGARGA